MLHPRYEESPSPLQIETYFRGEAPSVIFMSQTRFAQDENHGVLESSYRRLGPAALRAAIAAADAGTTPLLLESSGIGAGTSGADLAGLAVSIDEVSSSGHRDDTISAGGESTDKVAAARVCGESLSILAELERWGLGSPSPRRRATSCGSNRRTQYA